MRRWHADFLGSAPRHQHQTLGSTTTTGELTEGQHMPKTIVITGASDGIGKAAARRLVAAGNEVVLVGRSPAKTQAAAQDLGTHWFLADFSRLEEVRTLATELTDRYPRIDVLANNAGGVFRAAGRTVDGFETMFQVNHLAPFLLTNLLLPNLISARASVIQTSSDAARRMGKLDINDLNSENKSSAMRVYGDVKLENILFTKELHRRYHKDGISAAAFHPGAVATNFASDTTGLMKVVYANKLARRFLRGAEDGAGQLIWLATANPGTEWESGTYYEKFKAAKKTNVQADDAELASRLWDRSLELLDLSRRG
jgi:NAD(P)-dependent dehydrogenase (short-subunit alcohol dehydrogenase family)